MIKVNEIMHIYKNVKHTLVRGICKGIQTSLTFTADIAIDSLYVITANSEVLNIFRKFLLISRLHGSTIKYSVFLEVKTSELAYTI